MRAGIDYYSVLGVPRDVTSEDLKRRYRQLVRQHHPDVALDHDAARERFVAIVEAYQTLSDPARRRAYDALRQTAQPAAPSRSTQLQRQIDDWFRHAVHRLEQDDLNGAAAQCRKILALDAQHAAAHALLGDIHARRAEWDLALTSYSGAVAAAPRNPVYARKLRDAAAEGQRTRAAAERRERAEANRRRAVEALNARHEILPYAIVILLIWAAGLLFWGGSHPGAPLPFRWLPLPRGVALTGFGAGLLLGITLGLTSLTARPGRHGEPTRARTAVVFGLLSLVSFYLSAAVYCLTALLRDRLTPTLSAAFAATFCCVIALTGLSAGAAEPLAGLWRQTALWSGNLVFPTMLVGLGVGRLGLRFG